MKRPPHPPLSYTQERLWFLDQLGVGAAYSIPAALQLHGALDTAALRQSLGQLQERHEILRTRFASADGQGVQLIDPPQPFQLPCIDLSGLAPHERMETARRLARQDAQAAFDLGRGPLFRASLLRLQDEDHVLLA